MENCGIPILEKYSLLLKTLPYYSYTHNAWFLLSCFTQKSRKILKDNYKAFQNWMDSNLMQVEIENENIERRYSLPCDLFKLGITIESEEQATYFKKWIVKINLIKFNQVSKPIITNKLFLISTLVLKVVFMDVNSFIIIKIITLTNTN